MKNNTNKGITLIALVITVVVMLILVAVTISMAVNGGLFEYAGKAVGETQNSIDAEQTLGNGKVQIDGAWYDSIDDYLTNKPSNGAYATAEKDENGLLKENATYIDSNKEIAIIPKGFAIVPGLNNTTTIADGLVITDELDENGNSIGNEFVWIPVSDFFNRANWADNEPTTIMDVNKVNNKTCLIEPCSIDSSEYQLMKNSVNRNGGFYIGRYEVGTDIPRTNTDNGTSTKMVVQRDKFPYTYVGWGNSITDNNNIVTDQNGNNQGLGAYALSKAMYADKDVGVASTLCYGIQWDTILNFIKEDKNVTKSTDWGNCSDSEWTITRGAAKYYDSTTDKWESINENNSLCKKTDESGYLLTTGASDRFCVKNIYDLAGNAYEITNEEYYLRVQTGVSQTGPNTFIPTYSVANSMISRGGSFQYGSASFRGCMGPSYGTSVAKVNQSAVDLSFRVSLYIVGVVQETGVTASDVQKKLHNYLGETVNYGITYDDTSYQRN